MNEILSNLNSPSAVIISVLYAAVYIFAIYNCYRIFVSGQHGATTPTWILFHLFLPFVAVPFYFFFGYRRLKNYPMTRRSRDLSEHKLDHCGEFAAVLRPMQILTPTTIPSENRVSLLIDGDQTFEEIFKSLKEAKEFILIQLYILRSDRIGLELKKLLIEKSQKGVKVYIIYDGFGSFWLSTKFIHAMKKNNIEIVRFMSVTNLSQLQHINFRNHRKICIVDGETAFTGGLNVGEEYLGGGKHFRKSLYWRDTHVKIEGPGVRELCESFAADWKFTTGEKLALDFEDVKQPQDKNDLVLSKVIPTGPADRRDAGKLLFMHLILSAQSRIWIATPYFVPDQTLIDALELAALKGIDVRFILPNIPDHHLVAWASKWQAYRMAKRGVKFFFYNIGFMHQKVTLVDDQISMVGSSNFDNRAIKLNFETNVVVLDQGFAKKIESMLLKDLEACINLNQALPIHSRMLQRVLGQFAAFFAPLL